MLDRYGTRLSPIDKLLCALSILGVCNNKDMVAKLITYTEYDMSFEYSHERHHTHLIQRYIQILNILKSTGSILEFKLITEPPSTTARVQIDSARTNIELVIRRRDWSIGEWDAEWERIK